MFELFVIVEDSLWGFHWMSGVTQNDDDKMTTFMSLMICIKLIVCVLYNNPVNYRSWAILMMQYTGVVFCKKKSGVDFLWWSVSVVYC